MNQQPYYYNPCYQHPDYAAQQQRMYQMYQQAMRERDSRKRLGNRLGVAVLIFLAMDFVVVFFLQGTGTLELYQEDATYQFAISILFSLVCTALPFVLVGFWMKRAPDTNYTIPDEKVVPSTTLWYVLLGTGLCMIANIVANIIATILSGMGFDVSSGSSMTPTNWFTSILLVAAIAVVPAICEEFTMRGIMMQSMLRHGKVFAIVASSIVFGLLHRSAVQAPFAFMVGLVLAFICVQTGSLLPGILIHFLNNAMSAAYSIINLYLNEALADAVYMALFLFWIAAGIVGLLMLVRKNWGKPRGAEILGDPQRVNPYTPSTAGKVGEFLTAPVMLVALIALVGETLLYLVI
ncbi:MAG: CPBP family intramembrane metalloprotease [Clostridiales bacterium]|nr:CPBP family intramembrane metalloprotease [Clostridiales bacterium]